jgi:predicted MFS family arabinose efflux permease
MALFFCGGAIGSALGGWLYATFGWTGSSILGAVLPIVGLVYFSTERHGVASSAAEPS